MLRVIVVDDEIHIRDFIKNLLSELSFVEVVAEAGTINDMEKEILYHKPDLVFLDIQLNKKSSLEIVKELEKREALQFHLILITGYFDEYATTIAGELGPRFPRTTMKKPLDPEKLLKHVTQIFQNVAREEMNEIVLSTGHGRIIVPFDNFYYALTAPEAPNYIDIYLCDGGKHSVYLSLSKLLSRLPTDKFCKISGGILVNKRWINKVEIKKNKHICSLFCGKGDNLEFEIPQRQYAQLVLEFDLKS